MPYNARGYAKRTHDQVVGQLEKTQHFLTRAMEYAESQSLGTEPEYQEAIDNLADVVKRVKALKEEV